MMYMLVFFVLEDLTLFILMIMVVVGICQMVHGLELITVKMFGLLVGYWVPMVV